MTEQNVEAEFDKMYDLAFEGEMIKQSTLTYDRMGEPDDAPLFNVGDVVSYASPGFGIKNVTILQVELYIYHPSEGQRSSYRYRVKEASLTESWVFEQYLSKI